MINYPRGKELLFKDHHNFYYFTDGTYGPTKGDQLETIWTSYWKLIDGEFYFKHSHMSEFKACDRNDLTNAVVSYYIEQTLLLGDSHE